MLVLDTASVLDAARGYVWAALAAVVIWKLYPQVKEMLRSRDFTIKIAGNELTVQKASDQLHRQVADLERHVAALLVRTSDRAGDEFEVAADEGVSGTAEAMRGQRILWVDDHPENNAFVIKSFEDSGLTCDRAHSTAEALNLLDADPPYDLIITDMGRVEDGTPDPQAGVRFIRAVKEAEITTPIVVYASRQALERAGDRAMEAGAARVTSSPTDLLLSLRLAPASELKSAVGNQLRDAGLTVRRVPLRGGIDFIAERNGEHWGIEVKKWRKPPDEKKLTKLREQAKLARRQYSVDRVIAVVPGVEQLPDPDDVVPGVEFVPLDDLGDYVNRIERST